MNINDNEVIDSTNDTETTENEIELDLDLSEETQEDDVETLKKTITTLQKQKEHWRAKATTAKPEAKPTQTEAQSTLTVKDGFALAKANVADEDIDDILEYANFKKISVSEALKSNVVKNMLAEKEEFRKSQNVSTTPNVRRASPKITDDVILENARQGKLDESEDAIRALFRARMGLK